MPDQTADWVTLGLSSNLVHLEETVKQQARSCAFDASEALEERRRR